jgi:hypothetical protein
VIWIATVWFVSTVADVPASATGATPFASNTFPDGATAASPANVPLLAFRVRSSAD